MQLRNKRAMFSKNYASIPSLTVLMIKKFFGGQGELEFGHGSWLEMIRGKHVLPTVINKCFRVKDATGKYLQGGERCMEVVKSLLKLPFEDQLGDFNELSYVSSTARVVISLCYNIL